MKKIPIIINNWIRGEKIWVLFKIVNKVIVLNKIDDGEN